LSDVDVWFQDESRIGQQGSVTRIWALKGTRPRVIRQQQFEYAYIFGAVCPAKDLGLALVLPSVSIEGMDYHLSEISKAVPEGRHAIVVLDRAGWHMSRKICQFKNISLLPLPPASPELNPVEQVWEQLRSHSLANRCFENYQHIVKSCCKAWTKFTGKAGSIKNLCTRTWAII